MKTEYQVLYHMSAEKCNMYQVCSVQHVTCLHVMVVA